MAEHNDDHTATHLSSTSYHQTSSTATINLNAECFSAHDLPSSNKSHLHSSIVAPTKDNHHRIGHHAPKIHRSSYSASNTSSVDIVTTRKHYTESHPHVDNDIHSRKDSHTMLNNGKISMLSTHNQRNRHADSNLLAVPTCQPASQRGRVVSYDRRNSSAAKVVASSLNLDFPPSPANPSDRLFIPKYLPFVRCRSIFAAYKRIDHVGRGQYGTVDKCIDNKTKQVVAIKKVSMSRETEGFPVPALREIKLMARMNHPNILGLKEVVHSEPSEFNRQLGDTYLVFEYMEYDLGGILNSGSEFLVPEIKCLSKQLFEGLHYLEVTKVIHRDLKVANILLNRNGVLKIADFGLSRAVAKQHSYTLPVCTRWYRAPEVLLGDTAYTHAIDVWSAACIVAELFVGKPILQGGVIDAQTELDNEIDQFLITCELCGSPTRASWPELFDLKHTPILMPKKGHSRCLKEKLSRRFKQHCPAGIRFIDDLLIMNPAKRLRASQALDHPFFWEDPMPCPPSQIRDLGRDCHENIDKMPKFRQPSPRRRPRDAAVVGYGAHTGLSDTTSGSTDRRSKQLAKGGYAQREALGYAAHQTQPSLQHKQQHQPRKHKQQQQHSKKGQPPSNLSKHLPQFYRSDQRVLNQPHPPRSSSSQQNHQLQHRPVSARHGSFTGPAGNAHHRHAPKRPKI